MVRRILVTGGSGFIGTNYLALASGDPGVEILNIDSRPPRNPATAARWITNDLLDERGLRAAIEEFSPTHVLHLAARTGVATKSPDHFQTNTEGVRILLDVLRRIASVKGVVFTSSTLVCRIGYVPTSDTDYCPTTAYGASKVEMEKIIRGAGRLPFVWTIVRPVSIWGPWQGEPYRNLFSAIRRGWYVHVGTRPHLKSLGYVENVAHQMHSILRAPADRVDGRTMYLADHPPTELRAFAEMIREEMQAGRIRTVPLPLARVAARAGDLLRQAGWGSVPITSFRLHNILTSYVYDVGPINEIAAPNPYSLRDGVRRTLQWTQAGMLAAPGADGLPAAR